MQPVVNDHRGGSRGAGRPDRRGDAAESPERRCGGGWSRVVKVRRLLLCVGTPPAPASINDSLAAAAAWVVPRKVV